MNNGFGIGLNGTFKSKSHYIFLLAIAFIIVQLSILLNSFPAIYRIYINLSAQNGIDWTLWKSFWFLSEISGEIGLILRFAGACLFVAFSWVLLRKKFSISSAGKKDCLASILMIMNGIVFFSRSQIRGIPGLKGP